MRALATVAAGILLVTVLYNEDVLANDTQRDFTVVIANQSPNFDIVQVVVERLTQADELFEVDSATRSFSYQAKLSEGEWFHPLDIKVVWTIPAATGSAQHEFAHRFSLLIPFDYPEDTYRIPLFYETNVTRRRMDELDLLTNKFDQFEVFFSTYRIYDHYRSTSPGAVEGNFLKRVSNKLFEAAKALALQEPYIFRMNENARDWVISSYRSESNAAKRYRDLGLDALSVYWYALADVDKITRNSADRPQSCSKARHLLEALERDFSSRPGKTAFLYRNSNNDQALNQMRTLFDSRCPS